MNTPRDIMPAASLQRGRPWPLGAAVTPEGVNFAVFSAHATRIDLCLYDPTGTHERARLPLPGHTDGIWHGLLRGAGEGTVYGFRAHGPADPARGHRFNPHKLLLDPYARHLAGTFRWTVTHLGDVNQPDDPHTAQDNARDMWKARVGGAPFDWGDDTGPRHALSDTVLYELHVGAATRRHPGVPEALRGRFGGLASPAMLDHLRALGVTAVSLLPVAQHLDEYALARRGRVNAWGYNTLAFFVPDLRFAVDDPVVEFKAMVKALHAAGLEVIVDVVLNHTAESDQRGPTLSWRGLDNASWYRLRHEDARFYENHSGTGNSLDTSQPRVMQFVLDVLRYWVSELRVDGFRFDLAASLARGPLGFDARHALLQAIGQDPALAGVKLIAEPWDAGPGGYQLGHFPPGWLEWNDRFRDAARAFWVRKAADRGEFASRLAGSSDRFQHAGRAPTASVNYVTSHDGFTLRDVVSYDRKHNDANGEDNRDGSDRNLSWNCGAEGDSDLLVVKTLRDRLRRALLATLFLARGVPMLLGGDELGRTQRGNNNAYAHDDEVSWWDWDAADAALLRFTRSLVAFRRSRPLLSAGHWLTGVDDGTGRRDVVWLDRLGREMEAHHWDEANRFILGMHLAGPASPAGRDELLAIFNAEMNDVEFPLPGGGWQVGFDTAQPDPFAPAGSAVSSASVLSRGRSVLVLERTGA
jgi:glycogen operon protein